MSPGTTKRPDASMTSCTTSAVRCQSKVFCRLRSEYRRPPAYGHRPHGHKLGRLGSAFFSTSSYLRSSDPLHGRKDLRTPAEPPSCILPEFGKRESAPKNPARLTPASC